MIDSKVINAELLGVLIALGNNYIKKLPSNMIDYLRDNCDVNKIPIIDKNIGIEDQNISEETRMILIAIKLKYWCSSEAERKDIFRKMKMAEGEYKNKIEKQYSKDEFFGKYNLNISETESENEKLVNIKKKNIIFKIIDKIKRLFKFK